MRILRRRFNMVEIALALAVLSLGVSAILTMMPVGVSSGKQAIAENNTADAASYVLGMYNAFIMKDIQDNGAAHLTNTGEHRIAAWKRALKLPDPTTTNPDSDPRNVVKGADESIWKDATHVETLAIGGENTNLLWYKASAADTFPLALLYQQKTIRDSQEIVDFAAVVRVWSEQDPSFKSRKWDGTSGFDDANVGMRLFVELSWPAGVAYADREKRVYVLDVYDPQNTSTRIYE